MADEDGEPCTGNDGIIITVEVRSLADDIIVISNVVTKTPALYEVSYQPTKCGEHEISVKVNGMPINSSPFVVLVHNIPHVKNCKAVGEHVTSAMQNRLAKLMVQLADAEGDPCLNAQEVTVELKSLTDGSITKGSVVSKTPATYEVSYQPSKSGEHELSVKVNGMEINDSPFTLLVHNIPHPQRCKAVEEGIIKAEKYKSSKFMVQLAGGDGDPCVTEQEVIVELKSLVDGSITKGSVVSKTPATYEVSYQPSKSGEHKLSVKVNDAEINDSPFSVLVHNIPQPQNCKAFGKGIKETVKNQIAEFTVQLADADSDPCVTKQEVTAELKSFTDDVITKANIASKTPATYEVSYLPSRSGEHELSVKVNGMEISGSPFVLLVHNIPHPSKCKAVGEGIIKAEKHKSAKFMVQLADTDGDPCVTKQEVIVELKSLVDGSITKGSVVSTTPAAYEVSYQLSKHGDNEVSVKVNGMEINDSPFALLVHNIPHPQNCKAVGEGIIKAEKYKSSKFMVQLADTDGEPCITIQEVIVELKSLTDGSITKGSVVSKTPATYEVSYLPSRSGEHELSVKVNGMEISDSPFALLVHNIPHPSKCKAVGEGIIKAEKHKSAKFMVQLADTDGDPCVTKQEVIVELKSLIDGSITKGSVVSKTPAAYEVSYQLGKHGENELSVKVNGMEISDSPFTLLVHNIPHPQRCKAVGEGTIKAEKYKSSKFMVQLADTDGEPCITIQEVIVELKSLTDGSITKGSVVSKTPATYEVSYLPSRSGEHELSVKVNGMEISDSPFALLVHNIPHPSKCKAVGEGIIKAEKHKSAKFMVQLADTDGDPCVTKQEVIVELKSLIDGSITKGSVVSKTPAAYEVSYQLGKHGENELSVKVNGMEISDSPFTLLVHNIPHPQRCKAVGEGTIKAEKYKSSKFMVQLADTDGEPCITIQEVIVELKSLTDGSITKGSVVSKTPATYEVSYLPSRSGEHELSVKVNGMEINDSPFVLLVHNIPHPSKCKAVGEGIIKAEKHKSTKFMVQLADTDGDPCVTKQEVIVELKSLIDGSITKGSVVSKTPATYEVSYLPSRSGEHELSVKVNGMEISDSPFVLLVHNIPHPSKCTAVGEGIIKAQRQILAQFVVRPADADGDPCVIKQEFIADLNSFINDVDTKAIGSKTPATFEVTYQPSRNELSVKKYKSSIFMVQLADAEGDPCVTEQEVIVELKSLVYDSITKADVVGKMTTATYNVSYHLSKSGEHEVSVKVNGMHIKGSPFALLVVTMPDSEEGFCGQLPFSWLVQEAFEAHWDNAKSTAGNCMCMVYRYLHCKNINWLVCLACKKFTCSPIDTQERRQLCTCCAINFVFLSLILPLEGFWIVLL